MAHVENQAKGVDSGDSTITALTAAQQLLQQDESCQSILISGEVDFIVLRDAYYTCKHGDPIMADVTGSGCALSAITAAFAGVGDTSGLSAAVLCGLAGEQAAELAQGPGTFTMHLMDALYQLNNASIAAPLSLERHTSI